MSQEYFCAEHGPYNSASGQCPFCTKPSRPPSAPTPLGYNQDDMPTDLGQSGGAGPTMPARRARPSSDEDSTVIPGRQDGPRRSIEDDEETHLPRDRRVREELDQTELSDELEVMGLMGMLWAKSGRNRGKTYQIKDGTVIGRREGGPVNLVVDDPKVSNPHAKFAIRNNQFVVADMLSKNGTLVNGARIESFVVLNENDQIQIGSTLFVLKTIL